VGGEIDFFRAGWNEGWLQTLAGRGVRGEHFRSITRTRTLSKSDQRTT
jgi:hypothetical protein